MCIKYIQRWATCDKQEELEVHALFQSCNATGIIIEPYQNCSCELSAAMDRHRVSRRQEEGESVLCADDSPLQSSTVDREKVGQQLIG